MAETARESRGRGFAILNRVVRMGLTKKGTTEQRPKETMRARKPCGYLGEEMPGRRQARATSLKLE